MLAIPFPLIDPVALHLGPLKIHWYGMAYLVSILLAWGYGVWLLKTKKARLKPNDFSDYIVWAVFGIVIGGRLGYVLFYDMGNFIAQPLQILYVWRGGMSFHGGLIGILVATFLFCRQRRISFLSLGDIVAMVGPIGLFFGRIANFINAEHFGRVTDVSWAMIFPHGGPWLRHPSQLYEAGLEGLSLFILMIGVDRCTNWRAKHPGALIGVFMIGYAFARIFAEFYRVPDATFFLFSTLITIGQLLSLPLILVGGYFLWYAFQKK